MGKTALIRREIPKINNGTSLASEHDRNESKKVLPKSKCRNIDRSSSAGPSKSTSVGECLTLSDDVESSNSKESDSAETSDSCTTELELVDRSKAFKVKRKEIFSSETKLLYKKLKKLNQSKSLDAGIQNTGINNSTSVDSKPNYTKESDLNKSKKVLTKSENRSIDGSSSAGPSTSAAREKTSSTLRKQVSFTSKQKDIKRRTNKTRSKIVRITKRLTPALFDANKKTKQLMQPAVFIEFLNKVRRKLHPGVIARSFANNIDEVIYKIRKVLEIFEKNLVPHSSDDNAEARVIKDLLQRLSDHKDCLTCLTKKIENN